MLQGWFFPKSNPHDYNSKLPTPTDVNKLGVVGFQPEQLQQFMETATRNNQIRPTVYQGEYNIITRGMEHKILPFLRTWGISYYAHCPLAAGFLTGNFTKGTFFGTRFAPEHPLHQIFHDRYDNPELHQAVLKIEEAGRHFGICVREVALRWIFYHSALGKGDGIIIGCTSLRQIEENHDSFDAGYLPESVLLLLEQLWGSLRGARGELL
jgi:aflatoxin B1 aldehyde reductase